MFLQCNNENPFENSKSSGAKPRKMEFTQGKDHPHGSVVVAVAIVRNEKRERKESLIIESYD